MNLDVLRVFENLIGTHRFVTTTLSDAFIHTTCAAEFCQNAPVEDVRFDVINSVIQAHHEQYGCSLRYLVFLTRGIWLQCHRLLSLVSRSSIIDALHDALDVVRSKIKDTKIKLELLETLKHNISGDTFCDNHNPVTKSQNVKKRPFLLSSSRHLMDDLVKPASSTLCVNDVIPGICRHQTIIQSLLAKIWEKRRSMGSLRTEEITVQTLPGYFDSHSDVYSGLLLHTDHNFLLLESKKSLYKSLLLSGELRKGYIHKGYNEKLKFVNSGRKSFTGENMWLDHMLNVVKRLNVDLLLVVGCVDDVITDACAELGVVILDQVTPRHILALCDVTGTEALEYITDATEANIVELELLPWKADWTDEVALKSPSLVSVCAHNNSRLLTALICHPCVEIAAMHAEQLHHAIARLSHCITKESVLPGNGSCEKAIADALRAADLISDTHQLLFQNVAVVCDDFVAKIHLLSRDDDVTYDDPVSKMAAWENAVHLVASLLTLETEVLTNKL